MAVVALSLPLTIPIPFAHTGDACCGGSNSFAIIACL